VSKILLRQSMNVVVFVSSVIFENFKLNINQKLFFSYCLLLNSFFIIMSIDHLVVMILNLSLFMFA